jgi:hypothetical protein
MEVSMLDNFSEELRVTRQELETAREMLERAATGLVRHYEPDERIAIVGPVKPVRKPVEGINTPAKGETYTQLNAWRVLYGFNPVKRVS